MSYKILEGRLGKCPSCGEDSFIRVASLLREPRDEGWVVPNDILQSIYSGLVRSYGTPRTDGRTKKALICSNKRCRKRAPKHYWAEIVPGGVVGPFCKACLLEDLNERADPRGWRVDIPIYITPCNAKTMVEAQAALACSPSKPDVVLRDEDVTLF